MRRDEANRVIPLGKELRFMYNDNSWRSEWTDKDSEGVE